MKLRHPARKINKRHDSNSLSNKNLQQCPVWCVPSPLFFALAFSGFHQHIRNELYEFSLFKENEWPKKGSKRGSSKVYTHVGCVTYLFMINPHFQFACRWPLRITCFTFNLLCTDIFLENYLCFFTISLSLLFSVRLQLLSKIKYLIHYLRQPRFLHQIYSVYLENYCR